MNVLLCGPVPPEACGPAIGGVASHLWSLALALTRAGHDVSVLASNLPQPPGPPATIEGIQVHTASTHLDAAGIAEVVDAQNLPGPNVATHFSAQTLRGILEYRRAIDDVRPDVVHVHGIEERFFFAQAAAGPSLPLVTSVHSSHFIEYHEQFDRPLRIAFVRRNLQFADSLVFVSRFVRQRHEILLPGALDHQRIRVVHNPIDASLFRPIPQPDARRQIGESPTIPLLVYVGQLIRRKRVDLLIRAAVLAARSVDFKLLIVGAGVEERALASLIRDTNLDARVALLGTMRQQQLPQYFSAAEVFVLPSEMEGFALVPIEAMLCGCPVVGTPESLGELVGSDRLGQHLRASDPAALADALERALDTTWDRHVIRSHALGFDWDNCVGSFVELYEEIA